MTTAPDERLAMRPDCGACAGLCCVALPFARSADFALDKPAGMPCVHLGGDDRCGIHARLRSEGFAGCTVFDCLGAGQRVTQETFGGASWRDGPATAAPMFEAFATMRVLHELLWYLSEARLRAPVPLRADATALRADIEGYVAADATTLAGLDIGALRAAAGPLLEQVSAAVRGPRPGADLRRRDLVGQDLRRRDLVGADLRGALLIGADLRGLDLTHTDLLGADLRAADVRGADLREALFLVAPQVAAARGDGRHPHAGRHGPPDHLGVRTESQGGGKVPEAASR